MIRGLKLWWWLTVWQCMSVLREPVKHLPGLLLNFLLAPLTLIAFVAMSREVQTTTIEQSTDRGRPPLSVRNGIIALLNEEERVRIFGARFAERERILAAHRGHDIICWVCHAKNGCAPPEIGKQLDHGCHVEGGCPYARRAS